MPEFAEWRKKSEPFNFLATYCELISSLTTSKDNETINECLRLIFKHLKCPLQYQILLIKKISNHLLQQEIQVDQALLMEMLNVFEQFDAKDPMLTDKYFQEPLNSHEKLLIRTALKDSLTGGLITG